MTAPEAVAPQDGRPPAFLCDIRSVKGGSQLACGLASRVVRGFQFRISTANSPESYVLAQQEQSTARRLIRWDLGIRFRVPVPLRISGFYVLAFQRSPRRPSFICASVPRTLCLLSSFELGQNVVKEPRRSNSANFAASCEAHVLHCGAQLDAQTPEGVLRDEDGRTSVAVARCHASGQDTGPRRAVALQHGFCPAPRCPLVNVKDNR